MISKLHNQDNINLSNIKTIAGIDCAYWKTNEISYGVIAWQIFDYLTSEILEENTLMSEVKEDYCPGYLYFREGPLMKLALSNMKTKPDVLCCDGNGLLHPKFCGEATHFGIKENIPTIGIAKNLYKFEGLEEVGDNLIYENKIVGKKVFLNKDSNKASFISSGYRVSLEDAVCITINMQKFSKTKSKNSYITKGCDHLVREYQKNYIEKHGGVKA